MMVGFRNIRTLAVLTTVVAQLAGVVGQTTDAVCLPYFDWMSNSQHQSPCVIASSLLAVCSGGSYNVASLPDATHYLGPVSVFNANDCQCNTVTYSLMSACAACQGRSYISWSQWTANCPSVSASFPEPLPVGLHVPGWAYLDPRPSDNFDQLRAQKNTNLTESVVLPPPTSTSSSARSASTKKSKTTSSEKHHTSSTNTSSATASSSTTPNPSFLSASPDNLSKSRHANTIGGIVVGASVGGICILGFVIWLLHSRAGKKKKQGIRLISPVEEKPPQLDIEQGPRVIIEEPRDDEEDRTREHLQRYIEVTVPTRSPSSSATGTLRSADARTNSEPPTPTRGTHSKAT